MIQFETRRCWKCGRLYMAAEGGIVATPQELFGTRLCKTCKARKLNKKLLAGRSKMDAVDEYH